MLGTYNVQWSASVRRAFEWSERSIVYESDYGFKRAMVMSGLLWLLIPLAIAATAIVLIIGIGGFAGGGEFNKKYGNKLMQMRVLLQFIAIILICGVLYLAK